MALSGSLSRKAPGVSRRRSWLSTRAASAPTLSILLMKMRAGRWLRSSARNTVSVWACTPSRADTSSTAPSSAHMLRSTSAAKSA